MNATLWGKLEQGHMQNIVLTCSNHACVVSNLTSSFLCSLGSRDSSCFSMFVLAPVAEDTSMGELLSLTGDLSCFSSWESSLFFVPSWVVLGFVSLLLCFFSSCSCCFLLSLSPDCLAEVVAVGLVVDSIPILLMKSWILRTKQLAVYGHNR